MSVAEYTSEIGQRAGRVTAEGNVLPQFHRSFHINAHDSAARARRAEDDIWARLIGEVGEFIDRYADGFFPGREIGGSQMHEPSKELDFTKAASTLLALSQKEAAKILRQEIKVRLPAFSTIARNVTNRIRAVVAELPRIIDNVIISGSEVTQRNNLNRHAKAHAPSQDGRSPSDSQLARATP